MTSSIGEILADVFGSFDDGGDWRVKLEALKAEQDAGALDYLHSKFPGVADEVFFTDFTGAKHEHIIDAEYIIDAAQIEQACANCKGGQCLLSDRYKAKRTRPVAIVEEERGRKYLDVSWARIKCGNDNSEFFRLFQHSGLADSQFHMTFKNYEVTPSVNEAKAQAMKAARENKSLVLSGSAGAGKTHLAAAIAIDAMRHGRPAKFRLVSELVDELRYVNYADRERYYDLMREYKNVSCLVLDDIGKERTTAAGLDYVYQIVDYRYRYGLQTILTTNARSPEELARWANAEYILPMISRIRGCGAWVTISQAPDYRQKGSGVNANAGQRKAS